MVHTKEKLNVYDTIIYHYPGMEYDEDGSGQESQDRFSDDADDAEDSKFIKKLLAGIFIKTIKFSGMPQEEAALELLDSGEDNYFDLDDDEESEDQDNNSCVDGFHQYYQDLLQYSVPNKEEMNELFKRYWEGDQSAKEELITRNLRLVLSVVKKYVNLGLDFMDLIQEGNTGLITAVEKYDKHRASAFSTCAFLYIKKAITEAIATKGRTIRLPLHMQTKCRKVMRERRKILQETGKEPSIEMLMEKTGLKEKAVKDGLFYAMDVISLDLSLGGNGISFCDAILQGSGIYSPESTDYDSRDLFTLLVKAMRETLNEKEFFIIKKRFGMDGEPAKTLTEVGEVLNISRERVRQLERDALKKLKTSQYIWKLESYLVED